MRSHGHDRGRKNSLVTESFRAWIGLQHSMSRLHRHSHLTSMKADARTQPSLGYNSSAQAQGRGSETISITQLHAARGFASSAVTDASFCLALESRTDLLLQGTSKARLLHMNEREGRGYERSRSGRCHRITIWAARGLAARDSMISVCNKY
jgi:hypothetical protein